MTVTQDWDLLTEADIAQYLNLATTTIRVWRIRGVLPEPVALVSGVPVWARQTVQVMADRQPGLSPALRDHLLWLLRSRPEPVGFDEIVAHFAARGMTPGDPAPALVAILASLEQEGFIVDHGDSRYGAVPKLEAEGFDLGCLDALRAMGGHTGQTSVTVAQLSQRLGLAESHLARVAAALARLRDAGLVYPPEDGVYGELTPAGAGYLAEMADQQSVAISGDRRKPAARSL